MPAPRQGLADSLVRAFGLEPVDYDGVRDATQEHVAQAAQAFGTARSGRPCGFICNGSVVPMSARPQGLLRPYGTKKSAAMELTRWCLDGMAMRNATARRDATARVRVPGCRRQDGPTGGLPCWQSPSR